MENDTLTQQETRLFDTFTVSYRSPLSSVSARTDDIILHATYVISMQRHHTYRPTKLFLQSFKVPFADPHVQ